MFCRKCGTNLEEGMRHCPKCGTAVVGKAGEETKVKEENRRIAREKEYDRQDRYDDYDEYDGYDDYDDYDEYDDDFYDEESTGKRKSKAPLIVAIIAIVLAIAVAAVFFVLPKMGIELINTDRAQISQETEAETEEKDKEDKSTEAKTEETTKADKIIMPNVEGMKYDDAVDDIVGAGLAFEVEYEESAEVAEGYVIRQSIEEGRELNPGDTIMLFVAEKAKETTTEKKKEETTKEETKKEETKAETTKVTETTKAAEEETTVAPEEKIIYCCASEFVTLRKEASREAEQLTRILSREEATLLDEEGEWYYVEFGGEKGYVLKNYFSEDPEAPLNYGQN